MVKANKLTKCICAFLGTLVAGVFLASSGILRNESFALLPCGFSNLMLVITSMCGTVQMLLKSVSFFSTKKQ